MLERFIVCWSSNSFLSFLISSFESLSYGIFAISKLFWPNGDPALLVLPAYFRLKIKFSITFLFDSRSSIYASSLSILTCTSSCCILNSLISLLSSTFFVLRIYLTSIRSWLISTSFEAYNSLISRKWSFLICFSWFCKLRTSRSFLCMILFYSNISDAFSFSQAS